MRSQPVHFSNDSKLLDYSIFDVTSARYFPLLYRVSIAQAETHHVAHTRNARTDRQGEEDKQPLISTHSTPSDPRETSLQTHPERHLDVFNTLRG